jgi:2-oxo-4-hydroxy-4-carboxy-5-ureidoimidazoline decarboxylase
VAWLAGRVTLASFNASPAGEAVAVLLSCCASRRFAGAMAAGRPYPSLAAAENATRTAFESLAWDDVLEAMSVHPRIGDRVHGQSAAEQSGVDGSSRAALAAGNALYEERFGHVFLICATGRGPDEILAELRRRIEHDPAIELEVAATEIGKINALRLRQLAAA